MDNSEFAPTAGDPADANAEIDLHQEDLALVQGALQHEPGAERDLRRRLACVPRILRNRNAQLGRPLNVDEIPDLVQDTMMVVLKKLPEFRGRAALETWVYRICTLELLNAARRKYRRAEYREADPAAIDSATAPDIPQPGSLRFEELYRGLERLEDRDEQILRWRHYDELGFEEIGRRLGLTQSGAKHHYYRALATLRAYLEPREERE